MVHQVGGRKCHVIVAVLTHVARVDMCRILAGRLHAIVTVDAIGRDTHVVKVGREPGNGGMTVVTVVTARDVRRILARCGGAIMAGAASPQYLGVVHQVGGRKCHIVVAVLTHVARVDVRGIFAGRLHAVVTVDAIGRDTHVIEVGRRPRHCCMAVVTVVTAQNM